MPALQPVAFDIETTGFEPDARITVAGVATDVGTWQLLNTGSRSVDAGSLEADLQRESRRPITVETATNEAELLEAIDRFMDDGFDGNSQYLCGFNGETWRSGFDLPFLRTACARHDVDWPFRDVAYADVQSMTARFNTGDADDLVAVHETLVGLDYGDPFDDSAEAVAAFEDGHWADLLHHNLADLRRTHDLAVLAGRYVPKSDFEMKNLEPPASPTL